MLRLVHIFDLKSNTDDESFINWLEANLYSKAKEFGCEERKTWVYLDGAKRPYSKSRRTVNRPRYLIEAFWNSQKGADDFRQWLWSSEGELSRSKWNEHVKKHQVLRYTDFAPVQNMGDD